MVDAVTTAQVYLLHPRATPEVFGIIPSFLDPNDPRPVREQFDDSYRHGGGWRPISKFTMSRTQVLSYPGDPPYEPLAVLVWKQERVIMYPYGIVAIVQPDGSYECARMD